MKLYLKTGFTCECHGIFQEFLLVPKMDYTLVVFADTFVERMLQRAIHYEFRCTSVPHHLWITHLYAHHSTRSSVVFHVLLFSGILALVQVARPKHTFGWCSYTMHGSLNSICVNMFSEARAAVHLLFSHLQWWILVLFSCALTKACLSSWCFTSSGNWRVLSFDRWRGQVAGDF